jgi:hypothetical protein
MKQEKKLTYGPRDVDTSLGHFLCSSYRPALPVYPPLCFPFLSLLIVLTAAIVLIVCRCPSIPVVVLSCPAAATVLVVCSSPSIPVVIL